MIAGKPETQRIVITGVGLRTMYGNSLPEFRESLLAGRSGVRPYEIRYVGATLAGVCNIRRTPEVSKEKGSLRAAPGPAALACFAATRRLPTRDSIGPMSINRGSAFMSASPSMATSGA